MLMNHVIRIANKYWLRAALVAVLSAGLLLAVFGETFIPRPPVERDDLQSSDVSLDTSTGTLWGTLLLPSGKAPFPVVLIIAGSGQTDRDGNSVGLSGKSNCLRLLAEGLAKSGIASLRYDKRSVAKSANARIATNTFETQVDDAAKWVAWLCGDTRFRAVGIIGHSEGALVGTIAAQRGGARALVALAGAGSRFDEVLISQTEAAVRAKQLSPKALEGLRGAFAELRAGRTVTTRPPSIPDQLWVGLFQPRAQEYLISLFRYDPAAEITKLPSLNVKVLVVVGTTDLTGDEQDRSKLAEAIGAKPVVITGMNHELKNAPLDRAANDAASEDPKRPLAPGLLDQLISFLTNALR
ncbi:MAG: alpha/beta hydrolase [Blastocatellia bacterium AA13]|nr:MAG: alpha/beta hydrolase [Blastocatellia bacterium AA13]